MEYKNYIEDFKDLQYLLSEQAQNILTTIKNFEKEDIFMDFLEDYYNEKTPTLAEITNFIVENWQHIFKNIGINENF